MLRIVKSNFLQGTYFQILCSSSVHDRPQWGNKTSRRDVPTKDTNYKRPRSQAIKTLLGEQYKEKKSAWKQKIKKESVASEYMAVTHGSQDITVEDMVVRNVMDRNLNRRELMRTQMDKQRWIRRFTTIKNKFFKDPKEVNLLTWDAKEQIRFLHSQFPDEWTVDRLAESFPISEAGVIKLLRSGFKPRSLQELIRHDVDVKKNWKQLDDGQHGEGPLALRFSQMVQEGKLEQLAFAVGNATLPKPVRTEFLPVVPLTELNEPGPFSRMCTSYLEMKKRKAIAEKTSDKEEQQELYEKLKESNLNTLQTFLKTLQIKPIKGRTSRSETEVPQIESGTQDVDYRKAFWFRDYNVDSNEKETVDRDLENMSLFDMIASDDDVESTSADQSTEQNLDTEYENWKTNTQQNLDKLLKNDERIRTGANVDASEMQNDPGMRNTGIKRTEHEVIDSNTDRFGTPGGRADHFDTQKYEDNPIYDSMTIERSRVNDDTDVSLGDYYLYDEETGYQHPYGKRDKKLDDIEIPNKHRPENAGKTYKRGKDYFDEDGEFLFRGPD